MTTPHDSYKTMRAIGKPRDLTSFAVGRILLAAGLRTKDGQPTLSAKEQGVVASYKLHYGGLAWKWHEEFVAELLDEWLDDQPGPAPHTTQRGR